MSPMNCRPKRRNSTRRAAEAFEGIRAVLRAARAVTAVPGAVRTVRRLIITIPSHIRLRAAADVVVIIDGSVVAHREDGEAAEREHCRKEG